MSPYLSSDVHLAIFGLCMGLVGSVLVSVCAWYYLRRVRIERPPIGTFNGRDIGILFVLLSTIPLFYLFIPRLAARRAGRHVSGVDLDWLRPAAQADPAVARDRLVDRPEYLDG